MLLPGEFIRSMRIPKLKPGARFAVYKLSKRFDQDISAVCAAFHVDGDKARFGFGGMAATPARARKAEAAWVRGVEAACAALVEDFSPLSDQRGLRLVSPARGAERCCGKFHAGTSARALLDISP